MNREDENLRKKVKERKRIIIIMRSFSPFRYEAHASIVGYIDTPSDLFSRINNRQGITIRRYDL